MPDGARSLRRRLTFATLAIGIVAAVALTVFVPRASETAAPFRAEALLPAMAWPVSVTPPVLVDPLEIVLTETTGVANVRDFDSVGCEGTIHRITVPDGRDARVTMDEKTASLRYPVWINGGRHVHVIGLEMRPEVQPGCDVGEAHQVKDPRPNIHPRLVGGKALRFQQAGTTFVEGVDIDLAGMEADCIVSRNPDDMSVATALAEREIVIVNTRCSGIEGLDNSPVGDGIHGDFFQNQGRDDVGALVMENVSILSSSNGITLHNWAGGENRPRLFGMRNVDYGSDPRYVDDDEHEISGLAFTAGALETAFENVWLDDPRGLNYGIVNGQRIGAFAQSGYVERHPELRAGRPAGGSHARAERTGRGYVSPYRDVSALEHEPEAR